MAASSSIFLIAVLACLVISANTLKCWYGTSVYHNLKQIVCPPGNDLCLKEHCMGKRDHRGFIGSRCASKALCDRRYYEDAFVTCNNFYCCHGDLCNGVHHG
ncbi:hypothetical protein niasHS_009779 [Heterodera schachtii]|uniref:Uncharacterized protein n=1 Tax=Heterodera schachtii TaxID=97005 RepID=A0ABD2IY94_HETSC